MPCGILSLFVFYRFLHSSGFSPSCFGYDGGAWPNGWIERHPIISMVTVPTLSSSADLFVVGIFATIADLGSYEILEARPYGHEMPFETRLIELSFLFFLVSFSETCVEESDE